MSSLPSSRRMFSGLSTYSCHSSLTQPGSWSSTFQRVRSNSGPSKFSSKTTALLSYLFPLTARFNNTFVRHLGNAARLAVANLPKQRFRIEDPAENRNHRHIRKEKQCGRNRRDKIPAQRPQEALSRGNILTIHLIYPPKAS